MAAAAELKDISKTYRKSHLGKVTLTAGVSKISFAIEQGEVFGLLGLNGAGKTTTIKLLLGLLFPTSGSVELYGTRLPNLGVMRQVGYLPELPSFYKYLTVNELLELYGSLSGMTKAEVDAR